MATSNRIATIKDLVDFLGQFPPETNLVFEDWKWGHEPVLTSDLNHPDAWTSTAQYRRTFQGKEFTSSVPCLLL
jgi:hypothetical protein